jgi:hypothetical protein
MWSALAAAALVSLLVFWRGPNAVWAGVVLGSTGACGFALFTPKHLSWALVGKGMVVGVLTGAAAELLGRLAHRATNEEA